MPPTEKIREHKQQYGMVYVITGSIALLQLLGYIGTGYSLWDGKADVVYVDARVAETRQYIDAASDEINKSLNMLKADNVARKIDKILAFKCRNPSNHDFDANLRDLRAEYRRLTGYAYENTDCELLRQ